MTRTDDLARRIYQRLRQGNDDWRAQLIAMGYDPDYVFAAVVEAAMLDPEASLEDVLDRVLGGYHDMP